jgi:selenocysteine lyase/cysteine desulfurase
MNEDSPLARRRWLCGMGLGLGALAGGDCVRVTPALFTSPADLDRLVAALRDLAREG